MTTPGYQRFFADLKRRRVFRVMAVYGATAFVVIEAADVIFPAIPLPPWTVSFVVWLALLGFPVAIVLAWALEMTPEGVRRTRPRCWRGRGAARRVVHVRDHSL